MHSWSFYGLQERKALIIVGGVLLALIIPIWVAIMFASNFSGYSIYEAPTVNTGWYLLYLVPVALPAISVICALYSRSTILAVLGALWFVLFLIL